MKMLTLTLFSIAMGLLFGRYYSLVPKKMLLDYILFAYLSVKLTNNNDEGDLITVRK